jgi:hypothetical protein
MFRRFLALASTAALLIAGGAACAAPWPPPDPDEAATSVAFTSAWAIGLRTLQSFDQLQAAAGAKGKIVESRLTAETPSVVFEWRSVAPDGAKSSMRATLFRTGDYGVTITPAVGDEIVANNFGAFVCRQCAPPVSACGRRPSWIAHDLHWDNFDCRCTLTGPQSVAAAACK